MLLLSLFFSVIYENFRTFDNQFGQFRDYKAIVQNVKCGEDITVTYSKYGKSQAVTIALSLSDGFIRVKLSTQEEDFRYAHKFHHVKESKFTHVNCHYFAKDTHVYVANDAVYFPQGHLPLDKIIYQDKQLNHSYSNSFRGFKEEIKDRAVGFTFNSNFNGIYGLPEHTSHFNLLEYFKHNRTGHNEFLRMFNMDVFKYSLNSSMSVYGNIPFLMAKLKSESSQFSMTNQWMGMLWNNPSDTWVKMSPKHVFMLSESSVFDLYLFQEKPYTMLKHYTDLTGRPQMPQLFSIGYNHCRYSFLDQKDVMEVNKNFTKYQIPLDTLWLDIDHTDSMKFFTWNRELYPDPLGMLDTMAKDNRKMVTIIDPQVKNDKSFPIYQEGLDYDLFVKYNNSVFYGTGWANDSKSVWFDYLNMDARKYWESRYSYDNYMSRPNLYTWNDMNEPSIFESIELTLPKNAMHQYKGREVEHRQVHNVYGLLEHESTAIGQMLRDEKSKRPFVLSRSFYAGTQQFGPIWTGDNAGNNGHYLNSIRMLLQLNIAGLPFAGADVGGFFDDPSGDLLSRWYQLGALQPFYRAHSHNETERREPWLFEEKYMSSMNHSISMRYHLLPYIYTQFAHASATGKPIMTPLFFEYDFGYNIEDEYLFGDAIWVKGMPENTTKVEIELPEDKWYDYYTNKIYSGGVYNYENTIERLPMLLRGGHIIPMFNQISMTSQEMHDNGLLLLILVKNGMAKGQLYLDDFETFDYTEGEFVYKTINYSNKKLSWGTGEIKFKQTLKKYTRGKLETYKCGNKVEMVEMRGMDKVKKILVDGKSIDFDQSKEVLKFKVDLKIDEEWTIKFE